MFDELLSEAYRQFYRGVVNIFRTMSKTLCLMCVWLIVISGTGFACPASSPRLFQREHDVIKLTLMTTVNTQGFINYQIMREDENWMSILFSNGNVLQQDPCKPADCTFSGNAANGDFSITLSNVHRESAGTYKLIVVETNEEKACATLYVLGHPRPPTLSSNKDPSVGESVIVTCSSISTTTPTNHGLSLSYTWTINGQTNPVNSRYAYSASRHQLTISNVQKTDSTIGLKCSATEVINGSYKSSDSLEFTINVLYGPDGIAFNTSSTTIRQKDGSLFLPVECQSDCNGCTFRWNRGGVLITSMAILDLATLQKTEAGDYLCTASRKGAGSMNKQLVVQVIYGPDHAAVLPANTLYVLNDGITMDSVVCSSDCFPDCSLVWLPSLSSNKGNLSLGVLHKESAGEYTCVASNPEWREKSVNVTITVQVRYGPGSAVLNVTSLFTVTEGETIESIECTSECWPGCRQKWMNAGNVITHSTGTLSLGRVTRDKSGTYVCVSENTDKEYTKKAEATFMLSVNYPPDVQVQTTNATSEDLSAVLICTANGVPDTYTYSNWKQEWPGSNLARVIPGSGHSTVRLTNPTYENSGIYTCSVSNGVVKYPTTDTVMEASMYLFVKDAPVVLFPQGSNDDAIVVSGKLGDTLSVQVKIYSNHGNLVVNLKDSGNNTNETKRVTMDVFETTVELPVMGKVLNDSGFVLNITIIIEDAEDFTFYSVSIENDFKATFLDIDVKAEGLPETPRSFMIEEVRQHSIEISWFGNFNGGFRQTFAIQTSEDGTDWNNSTVLVEAVLNTREQYHQTVNDLDHAKKYYLRMYAFNKLGRSEHTNVLQATTPASVDLTSSSAAMIGGLAGGGVAVLVLVIVGVVLLTRRRLKGKKKDDADRLTSSQRLKKLSPKGIKGDEEEILPDEVENPMYVGANDMGVPGTSQAIYSIPQKRKQQGGASFGDIYAVVDKEKKKKGKKSGKNKTSDQDINEHSDGEVTHGHHFNGRNTSPLKKNVNQDRLVYADLVFANPPKGQKKLVIHGLDDMTEYAEVDLTKKADPLPDSDKENTVGKKP